MNTIATIGYEGANIDDFIFTLRNAKIDILIDIRELPISRRKGFSKNAIRILLEDHGIEYMHIKELGDPKSGRDAARAGEYEKFEKIFRSHIKNNQAQNAMKGIIHKVRLHNICLLCYERDPLRCHRSIVANELKKLSKLEITHLGVRAGVASKDGQEWKRQGSNSRQGVAACR